MNTTIEELQSKIEEKKVFYNEDTHNIKDYVEAINDLAEVYIQKEQWQKAEEVLCECIDLFPDVYRMLSTGLYRRVAIVYIINYYLVSQKLDKEDNIENFDKVRNLISSAEKEDITTSHDHRTSDEANIINRIDLYKTKYQTNENSTSLQKEKEDIFLKYFWSEHYENHKFSWE